MRKKLLFVVSLTTIMSVFCVHSQDTIRSAQKHAVYCELVGTTRLFSTQITVNVDFGQKTNIVTKQIATKLVDENGNPIVFNSMVDAMNYMAQQGWNFETAYIIGDAQKGYVYHWLLKKEIMEGEDIGIRVHGTDEL